MDYIISEDSKGTPYALFGVSAQLAMWLKQGSENPESLVFKALMVAEPYKDNGTALMDTMYVILGAAWAWTFVLPKSLSIGIGMPMQCSVPIHAHYCSADIKQDQCFTPAIATMWLISFWFTS